MVIKEQIGRETFYHVGSRQFQLAEVKLLIDAIQSSKFISQNKSKELIKKMKGFVSKHEADKLPVLFKSTIVLIRCLK